MAETKTDEQDQAEGSPKLGRVLDIAGICAGVLLGVIIFDVLSGGKVTRLLRRGKPCEGCQEKDVQDQEATRDG